MSKSNKLFFFILLGLTLAPYLALCFFDHPSADDYTYSNWTNFFSQQIYYYEQWSGRYFSNLILCLDPLHFHSFTGYKISIFLLIIFFSYSLYVFMEAFIGSFIVSDRLVICFAYTGVLFLVFDTAKSLVELIYWFAGSMTYLLTTSLFLLLGKALIGLFYKKKHKDFYICALLLFCVIGGNETLMFFSDIMIFSIFIYQLCQGHEKRPIIHSIALLILAGIFSLAVVYAPGNAVRALNLSYTWDPKHVSIFGFFTFLSSNIWAIITKDFKNIFFLIYVVLAYFLFNTVKSGDLKVKFPLSLLITLGMMALLLVPVGLKENTVPLRIINMTNYTFLIATPYLLFCFTKEGFFVQIVLIAIISLCVIFFNRVDPIEEGNYCSAIQDLISTRAARYDADLNKRNEWIAQDKGMYQIVSCPSVLPSSLFFADINPNPDTWQDTDYAKFWGKHAIKTDSWVCFR